MVAGPDSACLPEIEAHTCCGVDKTDLHTSLDLGTLLLTRHDFKPMSRWRDGSNGYPPMSPSSDLIA